MSSKDSFWKGVLQNAIGSFLAGLMLVGLGRAWFQNRFDSLLGTVQSGFVQVSSLQAQMNRLEQPKTAPAAEKTRHHKKKARSEDAS